MLDTPDAVRRPHTYSVTSMSICSRAGKQPPTYLHARAAICSAALPQICRNRGAALIYRGGPLFHVR
jgi:hypothetical protein